MVNKSVEAFRRLTVDMQRAIFNDAVAELNAQADGLVALMKAVVPRGRTGLLANSIRKQPGRKETTVVVIAGNEDTTVNSPAGPYNYARAVEFGTVKIPAHPFFFPTYRLRRTAMKSAMKRKIAKRIKQYSAE